jgi:mRNA interferase MazF
MGVAVAGRAISRGQVYVVRLDPTLGSEIKKTRPCVVVSPDELNEHLRTVIVAPMTTGGRAYPWRPRCRFQGRAGFVALDQLRTVDVERFTKPLGQLEGETLLLVLERLQDMFAE